MKRKWWLVPGALVLFGVLWILASDQARLEPLRAAIGVKPPSVERATSKPICSSPVNPNVVAPADCIPQYLANLPPDPGPEGMKTIEGIDADKNGVRDDVQRFIAEKWGQSERATKALTMVAKGAQQMVLIADSVSEEEAKKLAAELVVKTVDCYAKSVDQEIRDAQAAVRVVAAVTNTPQRHERFHNFEMRIANTFWELSDAPVEQLCGYNPAALPS